MGIDKEVVHTRVANIVGVSLAPPPVPTPSVTPVPKEKLWWFDYKTLKCQQKEFRGAYMYEGLQTFKSRGMCERALKMVLNPPPPIPPLIPMPPQEHPLHAVLPEVENIRITSRGPDFVRLEWDKVHAEGVAYKVWVDGMARGTAVREPMIDLAGLKRKRYKVEIRTQPYSKMDRRAPSRKVTYHFTTMGDIKGVYVPGLPPEERISGPPVRVPRATHLAGATGIVGPRKRKLPARAEELMQKRAFPKAVKEAIEKGLERKEAPRNIERIIEKVAKINTPGYILRRTIAKRMARGGVVQYKVDTDKGTIVYENADEKDANAILGMPTPTGEVIPLQIRVMRE